MKVINGKNQRYAKVVGIPYDVCNPNDMRKLADFAVNELGSVDIWVSNELFLLRSSMQHISL